MDAKDAKLEKMREICLALPETVETVTWGHPNFRVGKKIFSSYGSDGKVSSFSFKTDKLIQEQLVASDNRYQPSHYVGQHGWVTMTMTGRLNWKEIVGFIHDSYRLIAPKRLAKTLPALEN